MIRFVSCVSVKSCITRDSVKIFGSCRNTWTAKTSMHSILSLIKIRIADVSAHKKAGGVMRITLPDFLFERAFTFFGKFCIMKNGSCTTGCGSVWLECTAGGREVAGSNPVTPTDLLRRRAEVRACPRFWRTLAISERAFWHFR